MKFEQLKCFHEVAQTGSISKAAQKLYMTQPTVSKMIRNLEEEVDEILFTRSPLGVQLTEQGEVLWRMAQDVLQRFDQYMDEKAGCRRQAVEVKGTLDLALAPVLLQTYYQTITQSMKQAFPKMSLRLIETNILAAEQLILNNESALGVVLYDQNLPLGLDERIVAEEIYTSEIMLCSSGKSHYSKQKSLGFYDVPLDKMISIENTKNSAGFPKGEYNFYTTNLDIIFHKLLSDPELCVTLPRFIVERQVRSSQIKCIPEKTHIRSGMYFLCHQNALEKEIYPPYFLSEFKMELLKCVMK